MRTVKDLPGPAAAPLVGNALQFRRDRLAFLTTCAREHGDAVAFRIGPAALVLLSHPDAVRELLTARQHEVSKGPVLQRARAVLGDGLLTSEGETHRHDRRLLQAAFSRQRVTRYAQEMVDVAADRTASWVPGRALDLHAETVRTTLTVAGRTLFGTRLDDDVALVSAALREVLSVYGLLMLPAARVLLRLPPARRRVRRGTAALDALTARLIAERAEGRGTGDDLLSVLLESTDRRHARDQVVTMLLAGHETTANALAFAGHLLATHPAVQDRVAGEVLGVCGAGGRPSVEDLGRLPLTRATLAEALRLYPPSWAMGRQAQVPTQVGDVEVPTGTVLLASQWVLHRDPRWWPEPGTFDPGRFLTPAPDRPRFAFFPFGGGTRQCIGEAFAWTEGVLTLATILARWRLLAVPGRELTLDPLLTLRPRDGVWIVPAPREAV
ncbi:cytochrome P450 [Georgenia thermotolerans]|uniref:Cytochrome P450 n=1 Tax=Georgenia thermotolerans TaxID=527326 RepID=A0A7J5UQN0_9MICO|nr:cytochrome P450 [Georgenia thermotolerans]KAE8764726.1 cytochrome P450 [Georgenia thermotolerans]